MNLVTDTQSVLKICKEYCSNVIVLLNPEEEYYQQIYDGLIVCVPVKNNKATGASRVK